MHPVTRDAGARRGDFGWLLNTVLALPKISMCFLFVASLLTSECFQPQCFMCEHTHQPSNHPTTPKKKKKHLKDTHTGLLHNDTHTHRQAFARSVAVKSSHMNAETTCGQGELDNRPFKCYRCMKPGDILGA